MCFLTDVMASKQHCVYHAFLPKIFNLNLMKSSALTSNLQKTQGLKEPVQQYYQEAIRQFQKWRHFTRPNLFN